MHEKTDSLKEYSAALARMECPECGSSLKMVAAGNPEWRDRVCMKCPMNYGPESPPSPAPLLMPIPVPPPPRKLTDKQARRKRKAERKTRLKEANRKDSWTPKYLLNYNGKVVVLLASGQQVKAMFEEHPRGFKVDWSGRPAGLSVVVGLIPDVGHTLALTPRQRTGG
jgi:hypothetical protein